MTAQDPELSAALGWPGGISDPVLNRKVLLQMVAALMRDKLWEDHRVRHLWDQAQEQTESVAPGAWVASKDGRVIYDDVSTDDVVLRVMGDFEDDEQRVRYAQRIVDKLNAAPAQQAEPVAWECKAGGLKRLTQRQYDAQTVATKRHYTRIAPPQRTMVPLTEEEIAALVRAEIEALPSYPSAVEELPYRLARAVEKAVWEKNHGQA